MAGGVGNEEALGSAVEQLLPEGRELHSLQVQ